MGGIAKHVDCQFLLLFFFNAEACSRHTTAQSAMRVLHALRIACNATNSFYKPPGDSGKEN